MLPRDPEDATASSEIDDKKTDAVDVGDYYDPQCHEVGVARMAFLVPLHAEWLPIDQAMGHAHAKLGTPKPNTDAAETMLPRSKTSDGLRDPGPVAITDISIDVKTEAYATVQMCSMEV